MPFTDSAEVQMLRSALTGDTFTLGLFTSAPAADGSGGAEVTGGGYARVEVAFTVAAGAPSTATLSQTTEFPTATASWGVITHGVIFNSAGERIVFDRFTAPGDDSTPVSKAIDAGDVARISGDSFVISLGSLADFGA